MVEGRHILVFLVQVGVLLGVARGLGELFRRWKQPAVTAELLAGILMGPTVLGRLAPGAHAWLFPAGDAVQGAMLETVAWLGVLLLLLDTGLEIDFSIAWRRRGAALCVALAGLLLPLAAGAAGMYGLMPARYLGGEGRVGFALFMGAVMGISAMPVAARALRDLGLLKTDVGLLTLSALAVKDVLGWVAFTLALAVFTGQRLDGWGAAKLLAGTAGFAAVVLTWGRGASERLFAWLGRKNCPEPGSSLTVLILLGLAFGTATQLMGVHALFGFFLAGVMCGEARSLREETRGVIAQMVHAVFVPLFFVGIGLKIDFLANFHWGLVAAVCAAELAGRYLGGMAGVKLAGVGAMEGGVVAIGMTPGGMMEIVVATMAQEAGVLGDGVFVAIVCSAVVSSMALGPWLGREMRRRREAPAGALVRDGAVVEALAAGTREAALQELAGALAGADRTGVLEAGEVERLALEREGEYGTGIGGGVAIPHVRLERLGEPRLAVGFSRTGLEWNAPDGGKVHWVYLLASPRHEQEWHVRTLARIARAMGDGAVRARLEQAAAEGGGAGLKGALEGELGRAR